MKTFLSVIVLLFGLMAGLAADALGQNIWVSSFTISGSVAGGPLNAVFVEWGRG